MISIAAFAAAFAVPASWPALGFEYVPAIEAFWRSLASADRTGNIHATLKHVSKDGAMFGTSIYPSLFCGSILAASTLPRKHSSFDAGQSKLICGHSKALTSQTFLCAA